MRTILTATLVAMLLGGCDSSSTSVPKVDLDKVLDALSATLTKLDKEDALVAAAAEDTAKAAGTEQGADEPEPAAKPAPSTQTSIKDDPKKRARFLQEFTDAVNARKAYSGNVGTELSGDGAVRGFTDPNRNMKRDSGETELFKIEIDEEKQRFVASDTNNYSRSHGYHSYGGGHFFTGMLLGNMLSRQRTHYSGRGGHPDFTQNKPQPRGYHKAAASRAARSRSSARMRSGSRSFSGGK